MNIISNIGKRIITRVISCFTVCSVFTTSVIFMYSTDIMASDDIEFNTDVLDIADRNNIDISLFSKAGYMMPGVYPLRISLNGKTSQVSYSIDFFQPSDNYDQPIPCITPDVFSSFNMRSEWNRKAHWLNGETCLDIKSIPGMTVAGDLAKDSLVVTIPQAYLEYSAIDWDPPSRWDNGISGVIFDYNFNTRLYRPKNGRNERQLNGNGIAGINLGPWRFRADWQTSHRSHSDNNKSWDWTRYYAYRAIPQLSAKLSLGENYLSSDVFDSFRFIGAELTTEDNMLPPNLRGYAPEVTGVAKTNATVTIKQLDRVIYQTQVAPGPFRIQELNDYISGKLDVTIEEEDGEIREFQVDTATIPYLTRPGQVQYKIAAGKPNNQDHKNEGPGFGMGEFSWGVSNGWSLYGGLIGANNYNAFSIGVGRDLLIFGAISFDVTRSRAKIASQDKVYSGNSYRVSYSKTFEEYDSQISFAGYRFSEEDFMNMDQYIDSRYHNNDIYNSKEMYTVNFSKRFSSVDLSSYFSYSHETYWNNPARDYYNLSLSKYFDVGSFKSIAASLSAYRNKYNKTTDNGLYFNISIPFGDNGYISYNNMFVKNGNSHSVGYYDRLNDRTTYNLSTGINISGKPSLKGYLTHESDYGTLTANGSYENDAYSSLGLSMRGGMTATLQGAALHRANTMGGSRVLIGSQGVSDVPVSGFGNNIKTNYFGKAIINDVNDYYRNTLKVDVNKLPDNAEVFNSVQQITLTEGAIGYREFDVLTGYKMMVNLQLDSSNYVPFGASVRNNKKRNLGIVGDMGNVYISGINPGEKLDVIWNDVSQCQITIPTEIDENNYAIIPLSCVSVSTPVKTMNHINE